jgi:glycolate oxidase FAD binding subunit
LPDLKDKVDTLLSLLGPDAVRADTETTAGHAIDGMAPGAVVFPKNTDQVSKAVRFSRQENLAVVPWGSGSKMTMGNPPERVDLVLSTRRMDHMIDVDTANMTITAEAGVKFRDIQARLATEEDRCYLPLEDLVTAADEVICSERSHSGSFLPLDPTFAERATIGGIIASNSSGPRQLLYRLPRDMILGVRMVAPNGDVLGSGGKTVKNVSGYDISKLMVGSLGTLGILCDMTFKLLPLPEKMETLLLSFDAFSGAAAFAERVLETTLLPAALEVMNGRAFNRLAVDGVSRTDGVGYMTAVALEGFEEAVDRMKHEIRDMAEAQGAATRAVLSEERHRSFWLAVSGPSAAADGASATVRAKLNYPRSAWKRVVKSMEDIFSRAGLAYAFQAGTGSGVCQLRLSPDADEPGAVDRAVASLEALLKVCREAEGNLMIQHAPVELKPRLKIWGEAGSNLVVMKRIKNRMDPKRIMSPGRFVGGL